MDSLYVKTDDGLVKLTLGASGSSGGTYITTRESKTLSSVLPTGTAYEVPEHEVGASTLAICFNGVLCKSGEDEQYVDVSSTTIKFNFDLPAGSEIDAIQFEGGVNALSKALS